MAKFEGHAADELLLLEGKYINDPKDAGGETMYGITRKFHPEWMGWHFINEVRGQVNWIQKIESDPKIRQLAIDFYKPKYWDPLDGVDSQALAECILNIRVLGGAWGVWIQRTINAFNLNGTRWPDVVVDGKIGPSSIAAINAATKFAEKNVIDMLLSLWSVFLLSRCEIQKDDPEAKQKTDNEKWEVGWSNRVIGLRKKIGV